MSPKIFSQIALVMNDLTSVSKDRMNEQQRYKFRGIDDVYNALHTPMAKHGIFTVPTVLEDRTEERTTKSGTALIYRVLKIKFTFFADDGSSVDAIVIGEGMDSGDKASNKAMAVAHKYALLQVFAIPTEEDKDPEISSPEVKPKPKSSLQSRLDEPGRADIYTGTTAQKNALFARCSKEGIPTDKMKDINVLLHDKKWEFLDTLIIDAKAEMEKEKKA